jgi:hypothetical protein
MIKNSLGTRTFYLENPLTAGHPVKGTSVTIAMDNTGACLVGDSPITWDEAAKKPSVPTEFGHYEYRRYSEQEATDIINGKVTKLIADGYVFEAYLNMRTLMQTGQQVYEVHEHNAG